MDALNPHSEIPPSNIASTLLHLPTYIPKSRKGDNRYAHKACSDDSNQSHNPMVSKVLSFSLDLPFQRPSRT
jgi:hypothetical protein